MRGFCCGACELEISSDEAPQQTEVEGLLFSSTYSTVRYALKMGLYVQYIT